MVQSRVRANRFWSGVPFWCTGTVHELSHVHFWGLDGLIGLVGLIGLIGLIGLVGLIVLVGHFKPHFAFRRFFKPSGATMMEIGFSNLSISHFSR